MYYTTWKTHFVIVTFSLYATLVAISLIFFEINFSKCIQGKKKKKIKPSNISSKLIFGNSIVKLVNIFYIF